MLRSFPRDWPRRGVVMPRPQPEVKQVVDDLEAGRVDSLAAHIRDRRGQIDVQVALALYDLIVGGKELIGFRMVLEHHPDRKPAEKSATRVSNDYLKLAAAVAYYHETRGERLQKAVAPLVSKKFGIATSRLLKGLQLHRNDPAFAQLCELVGSFSNR